MEPSKATPSPSPISFTMASMQHSDGKLATTQTFIEYLLYTLPLGLKYSNIFPLSLLEIFKVICCDDQIPRFKLIHSSFRRKAHTSLRTARAIINGVTSMCYCARRQNQSDGTISDCFPKRRGTCCCPPAQAQTQASKNTGEPQGRALDRGLFQGYP